MLGGASVPAFAAGDKPISVTMPASVFKDDTSRVCMPRTISVATRTRRYLRRSARPGPSGAHAASSSSPSDGGSIDPPPHGGGVAEGDGGRGHGAEVIAYLPLRPARAGHLPLAGEDQTASDSPDRRRLPRARIPRGEFLVGHHQIPDHVDQRPGCADHEADHGDGQHQHDDPRARPAKVEAVDA